MHTLTSEPLWIRKRADRHPGGLLSLYQSGWQICQMGVHLFKDETDALAFFIALAEDYQKGSIEQEAIYNEQDIRLVKHGVVAKKGHPKSKPP
eukprot:11755190-Alexandrium_andersonii.AAC.1